jgi:hypothetical protein
LELGELGERDWQFYPDIRNIQISCALAYNIKNICTTKASGHGIMVRYASANAPYIETTSGHEINY